MKNKRINPIRLVLVLSTIAICCSMFVGCNRTKNADTTLTYIGHAAVKIIAKDGTVIYIDPNPIGGDYSDPADLILVTHGHDDHTPNRDVVLKEGGTIVTHRDVHHDDIYETLSFGNITVEGVAAGGNINHDINLCVGYIVTVDGITVYHAGDTSMLEEMAALSSRNIDYAMYPVDGIYNMKPDEATKVANLVGAKHNIPIHTMSQAEKKRNEFNPEGKMIIEEKGTVVLTK